MRAPVSITRVQLGQAPKYPILLPTDFVLALSSLRKLHILLPHEEMAKTKETLSEFWRRWKNVYGADHTVFTQVAEDDLSLCLPVRLHGDEGRSSLTYL